MNALKQKYVQEIVPAMKDHFHYRSVMQAPKLEKIIVNMGIGDASRNKQYLTSALDEMTLITGQKPVVTKAKKAEANFKIRENMPVGCKVTLRGEKMYNFLEKLIHLVLPQTRDFRGLSLKSFDSQGNYSFGIKEQLVFPEVKYENVKRIQGMDITLVLSKNVKEENLYLLEKLGIIFYKHTQN